MSWDEWNATLQALSEGAQPTGFKYEFLVYANARFKSEMEQKIERFIFKLSPITESGSEVDNDLSLSCKCAAVAQERPEDARSAIAEELSFIFAMAYSAFSIGAEIKEFFEIDGKWMLYPSGHGKGYISFLPDASFDAEVTNRIGLVFSAINCAQSQLGGKLKNCISLLARGNQLERNWMSDSFLSYYRALEIIVGELKKPWAASYLLNSELSRELVKYDVLGDRTQRLQTYFIMKALGIDELTLNDALGVARLRNDIAHSSAQPTGVDLWNCKVLAYSALLRFSSIVCKAKMTR